MARIYVSHPFSGNEERNRGRVVEIASRLAKEGHVPLAPQIYLPSFIDEATERDMALKLCLQLVALADELRVYGEVSEGMRLEIAEAERLGIPILKGECP